MAPWQARAGVTLLIPSGPRGEKHLYVVLNDPTPFPGYGMHPCIVLVNLSTVRYGKDYDPTCILEAGSHPFVKERSFVVYRSARLEPLPHVTKLVKQGFFKPHQALEEALLARIRKGLVASPFAKREFKQLAI